MDNYLASPIAATREFHYTEHIHSMNSGKIFWMILILLVLTGNVILVSKYATTKGQLENAESVLAERRYNEKIISFTHLFIDKVLKAESEVSFEDRLQLENSVRDLKDDEIIGAWNSFVNSKNEVAAQNAVKNLLGILVDKIRA